MQNFMYMYVMNIWSFMWDASILSSNLFDQAGHVERSERRLLCYLHYDGVTCSQSRAQFPRLHQQREIPLAEKEKDAYRWYHYMGERKSKEESYPDLTKYLSVSLKQTWTCSSKLLVEWEEKCVYAVCNSFWYFKNCQIVHVQENGRVRR